MAQMTKERPTLVLFGCLENLMKSTKYQLNFHARLLNVDVMMLYLHHYYAVF